ncbi:hypothetical protein F2Q69_00022744 [Brassica cretica]|uniref:Uncharacterized protein n=1 Tax=Brassica cretica TaxID=69181 RepID=A0A8S9PZY8_BRACR|nr:hypothetical protein F2Q69_00022744 [Brassica cretica]
MTLNNSDFDTILGEELRGRGDDGFWSIQLGRSLNWTDPSRRTAELDPVVDQSRPFAELYWSSSANGRAESRGRSSSCVSRPLDLCLQHVDVVPKVEFSAGSIDPEEVNAYWVGRGEVKPPVPGLWVPSPFKANPVAGCPSRGCPNGLAAIRRFCRVPELVEFCLPEAGEVALSPPEGNFTCYEAYLMQCHLCYKLGVTLDADHLEASVEARWSSSPIIHARPRSNKAIISGDTSVEESAIPVFRTRWGQRVSNTLNQVPEGFLTIRELFRRRTCFWADFTPKRVRRAVALHHSRFQPDLPIEEGSESNMDGFIPYVPRTKRDSDEDLKSVAGPPTHEINHTSYIGASSNIGDMQVTSQTIYTASELVLIKESNSLLKECATQNHMWKPGDHSLHLRAVGEFLPCTSSHMIKMNPLFVNLPYMDAFTFGVIEDQRLFPLLFRNELETFQTSKEIPRMHLFLPKLIRYKERRQLPYMDRFCTN